MNFRFKYDKVADVLYASLDVPRSGYAEEPFDGILVRRDIETKELIGFTIINFRRQKQGGFLGELRLIPQLSDIKFPPELE